MHFSTITFLASLYASKFYSGADYALYLVLCIWGKIAINLMQKQHLLMVLFGTNLVSNSKALKKYYIYCRLALLNAYKVQIECRF